MPIKIFAATGDHRDDFRMVQDQYNEWETEENPRVVEISTEVCELPTKRENSAFMLTLVARYEK